MLNGWQEAYKELTGFIAEHSEIEIGPSRVRLPDNIRPEFYRVFNDVRRAFIDEKFPSLISEASNLNQNYIKAEQEIIELLKLDNVSMEADLGRFLHDPIEQLIRGLFDPLFNLLKGRINVETFEATALQNMEASFRLLYQLGYEKWVVLSLIKLLEADESFQVPLPKLSLYDAHKSGGSIEERVHNPEGSKSLLFNYDANDAIMIPDCIVHSAKISRYIAVRSQIYRAFAVVADVSEKREWYSIDSVVALALGTTLIYVADNPDEISLVADSNKICRPDLIIECREQSKWLANEGLEKVKLQHNSLKPTLGTYIVTREPVPEQILKEPVPGQVLHESATEQEQKPSQEPESKKREEDIHILTVGFDQSKLESIISALV